MFVDSHCHLSFPELAGDLAGVLARMKALSEKLFAGLDYAYGFFNVELIYDPDSGRIQIVEINPRMASQIMNLYRRVDGYDPYQVLFDLALGEAPQVALVPPALPL